MARGLARRILVLAPPALIGQWRQEMREKFDLEFVTHDDLDFRQAGPEAWSRFTAMMERGTRKHTYQQLTDELNDNKISLSLGGSNFSVVLAPYGE